MKHIIRLNEIDDKVEMIRIKQIIHHLLLNNSG